MQHTTFSFMICSLFLSCLMFSFSPIMSMNKDIVQYTQEKLNLFSYINSSNTITKFLEQGVDPNICDQHNRTLLYYAVINRLYPTIDLLLMYGAFYGLLSDGYTSLHNAAIQQDYKTCEKIIQHTQKVDALYKNTTTLILLNVRNKTEKKPFLPKVILLLILKKLPIMLQHGRENYPSLQKLLEEKINNNASKFNRYTAYAIMKSCYGEKKEKQEKYKKLMIIRSLYAVYFSKAHALDDDLQKLKKIEKLVDPTQRTK